MTMLGLSLYTVDLWWLLMATGQDDNVCLGVVDASVSLFELHPNCICPASSCCRRSHAQDGGGGGR